MKKESKNKMKIEQIDKEQVLEYLYSRKDVFAIYIPSMEMDNLCSVNINVIMCILDSDDYVYFVLNGGDSNE